MNDDEVGGTVARQSGMRCAYQMLLEMMCRRKAVQRYEYINKMYVKHECLV
jgi:hypothetical protein